MTGIPRGCVIASSAGMSTIAPVKCTGMIALVRGVIASASCETSMQKSSVQSTNIGPCANVGDRPDRGNERVGGGDDFVAGPNADRLQAEAQRIRSRVDAEWHGDNPTQLGKARLEFFDRFAQRVIAGRDHFSQPRKDRFRIRELLRQIGERNPHVSCSKLEQRCRARFKSRRCSRGKPSRCPAWSDRTAPRAWQRSEPRCAARRRAADGCADARASPPTAATISAPAPNVRQPGSATTRLPVFFTERNHARQVERHQAAKVDHLYGYTGLCQCIGCLQRQSAPSSPW